MSKDTLQRIINKDMKEIRKMQLSEMGIHVHFEEDNIMKAIAIIMGPKGSPYENGLLYFVIQFPHNYPYAPPQVGYLSHSRYRIHPNLYVGSSHDNFIGKVCLSSINTWSGPKWSTVMHIGSVLLSIQSLLCNNPLHNEPGFEKETGEKNDLYNLCVEYDTYRHLIANNGFNIHPLFEPFTEIVNKHLKDNGPRIIERLNDLCEKHPDPAKISLNVYRILMAINYPQVREDICVKLSLL
jgi:ubiquitin-conjugating enzyme E2 Z